MIFEEKNISGQTVFFRKKANSNSWEKTYYCFQCFLFKHSSKLSLDLKAEALSDSLQHIKNQQQEKGEPKGLRLTPTKPEICEFTRKWLNWDFYKSKWATSSCNTQTSHTHTHTHTHTQSLSIKHQNMGHTEYFFYFQEPIIFNVFISQYWGKMVT